MSKMTNTQMIARIADRVYETFSGFPPVAPTDADIVGDMLLQTAEWFEQHPGAWIRGQEVRYSGSKAIGFCNVGVLKNSKGPINWSDTQRAAYSRQNRISDTLVAMNDNYAKNRFANALGLRFVADVLYKIAVGWSVRESVDDTQTEYTEIAKTYTSKGIALDSDKELKNAQVRAARKEAKMRGFDSVSAMRKSDKKKLVLV